jgi:hypothetical protein
MGLFESRMTGRRRLTGALAALSVACVASGIGLAAAGGRGEYVAQLDGTVPQSKLDAVKRGLPSYEPESSARAPVPTGNIHPVHPTMLDAYSPPMSPSLLRVENGWMVANGRRLVAVYAGTAGDEGTDGRLVIIRQDLEGGTQTANIITVRGAGALRITAAPRAPGNETADLHAKLSFRGGGGPTRMLDLSADTIG